MLWRQTKTRVAGTHGPISFPVVYGLSLSFNTTSITAIIFVALLQLNSPAFVSPFSTLTTQDALPRIAVRPTPALQVPQPIETMLGLANYQLVSRIPLGQGMSTFSQAIVFFFLNILSLLRNSLVGPISR